MEKRRVGQTDVYVSVIGIGAWQMGGADTADGVGHGWGGVDDQTSIRIIHEAEELGVNLIDTADIYGNGHSEGVIAQSLHGRRDRWILATKGGLVKDPERRGQYFDGSAKHIREACEKSLTRLRTEYIDIYQLHGMPPDQALTETVSELARLQDEGKVRFYGISTGISNDIKRLHELGPVHVAQIRINLIDRSGEEALRYCAREGIGVFVRTPLAWGAAFGRYAHERPPTFEFGDNRHGESLDQLLEAHSKGSLFSFLWTDTGRTPAQAALRFAIDQPGVSAAIPGMKKLEQLHENVGAMDVPPLTEGEHQRIAQVYFEAIASHEMSAA